MLAAMKFPILSCAIVLTLALGALNALYADSATWSTNPTNGDWNNPANWTPHTVPNGPSDVARSARPVKRRYRSPPRHCRGDYFQHRC